MMINYACVRACGRAGGVGWGGEVEVGGSGNGRSLSGRVLFSPNPEPHS